MARLFPFIGGLNMHFLLYLIFFVLFGLYLYFANHVWPPPMGIKDGIILILGIAVVFLIERIAGWRW